MEATKGFFTAEDVKALESLAFKGWTEEEKTAFDNMFEIIKSEDSDKKNFAMMECFGIYESVRRRIIRDGIKEYCKPISVGGISHDIPESQDIDLQKYFLFFQAINYDKEVCDMILDQKNSAMRLSVLEMSFADLVLRSKNR